MIQIDNQLILWLIKDLSIDAALQAQYKLWRYYKQARGRSVDAALFVEELTEIYSTPTPNAMAKAGKIVLIMCSSFFTITTV